MPTEPEPDPLRRRIEAILSRSWYRTVDDEGRRVKEIDEARAAAELVAVVGPLVVACRRAVGESVPYVSAWEFDDYTYPCTDPQKIHAEIVAALAAIDGPGGAEGESR